MISSTAGGQHPQAASTGTEARSWLEDWRAWRCLPKLDVRRVGALWQLDANRIVSAFGVVVFAKLVTQTRGLDAHEGVDDGVERLGTIEDLQSDVVAFEPVAAPGQSFIDDVLQEPLPAARLRGTGRS